MQLIMLRIVLNVRYCERGYCEAGRLPVNSSHGSH